MSNATTTITVPDTTEARAASAATIIAPDDFEEQPPTKKQRKEVRRAERQAAEDDEIAAQDAELDASGREYARTWRAYEEARARLMQTIVHEVGSVANINGAAHRDLTDDEVSRVLIGRKRAAQWAWSEFQSAEAQYMIAVDGNMPVEFRQP